MLRRAVVERAEELVGRRAMPAARRRDAVELEPAVGPEAEVSSAGGDAHRAGARLLAGERDTHVEPEGRPEPLGEAALEAGGDVLHDEDRKRRRRRQRREQVAHCGGPAGGGPDGEDGDVAPGARGWRRPRRLRESPRPAAAARRAGMGGLGCRARQGQARRGRGADSRRQSFGEQAPAVRILGLRQELDGAGAERLESGAHLTPVGARSQQNGRHRPVAAQPREDAEAVQQRHHDVEQQDIGSQPLDEIDGGLTVGRLADDLDVGRPGEEAAQDGAHGRGVVDEDDLEGAGGSGGSGRRGGHDRGRPQSPVRRRTVSTRSVATRLCLVR